MVQIRISINESSNKKKEGFHNRNSSENLPREVDNRVSQREKFRTKKRNKKTSWKVTPNGNVTNFSPSINLHLLPIPWISSTKKFSLAPFILQLTEQSSSFSPNSSSLTFHNSPKVFNNLIHISTITFTHNLQKFSERTTLSFNLLSYHVHHHLPSSAWTTTTTTVISIFINQNFATLLNRLSQIIVSSPKFCNLQERGNDQQRYLRKYATHKRRRKEE